MKVPFIVLLALYSAVCVGQNKCGQQVIENEMRANDAVLDAKFEAYKAEVFANQTPTNTRGDLIIIPIVFHIIHNNGPENISDAQVHDAVRILNEDYLAENSEISEVLSTFVDDIGVADIEFRLAKLDPDGDETTGIERIESIETYVGDDDSKLNPWPRDEYLNIWVTDAIYIGGAAAYAYRPPAADGLPLADGIISNHRYVGTIGTADGYNGKTLTHEIGHYLGLPHTWGETNAPGCDGTNPNEPCNGEDNCLMDDGISDTPLCLGVSAGNCDYNRTTCGSLDNIQNFMDYASCEVMFTAGQVSVMRNSLNSSVADRNDLWTSSNLAATGVSELTAADFRVDRVSFCVGDTIQFHDASTYGAESWQWTITGPIEYTSTSRNPEFVFTTPGLYDVELTVTQGSITKTISRTKAVSVSGNYGVGMPFIEDFAEDGNWIGNNNGEESSSNVWERNTDFGNGDNASMRISNLGAQYGSIDDLIYSSIDFRPLSQVSISFDIAYAQIATSNTDRLRLLISNDCGQNWQQIWSKAGIQLSGSTPLSTSVFEPESSDWESFTVNNPPIGWFSEKTLINFQFISGGGNHLFIDNINITGTFSDIPQLVYPGNNSPSMNDNVRLDWQAVPDVASYTYELDEVSDFTSSALQTGTLDYLGASSTDTDTEFNTSGLTHGQQYFWRVRSTGASVSSWSEVWNFTVADDGVGAAELSNKPTFTLYPNPAFERLSIAFDSEKAEFIELLSIDGKVLIHKSNIYSQNELDVHSLDAGIYFIRIEFQHSTAFEQVIIVK